MSTLLIRGGRVIDPAAGTDAVADVLVADGTVAQIGTGLEPGGADVLDAAGCLVLPGLVDLHTHLREPGFEQKGTIATETLAALRGGYTTVCAMPNTEPPPDAAPAIESLHERITRDARVRVLPVGCTTRGRAGERLGDLGELAAAGCVAFSDDGSPVARPELMRGALEYAAALGIPVAEHCDEPALSGDGGMHEGATSERLGLAGQPEAAEVSAIARNLALCELTGGRLHIMHLTTGRGVELVADAKARGLPVTCEVTPSHLFLTEAAVLGSGESPAYDTNAKVNPPLRTEADRRALLTGVNSGVIDAIASDHAPHAPVEKLCEFDRAPFGISCIETALGTVLTMVDRGELDLLAAIRALTTGPVAAFALDPRVPGIGTLSAGVARDLTVADPAARWTVEASRFVSKGKNSPLDGVELTGRATAVILDGALAYKEEAAHA